MTAQSGIASGPVTDKKAPPAPDALPGFAPSRTRASRHMAKRRPRPAAASRAGLFVWVPVCLSAGIAFWFALPILLQPWQWMLLAAGAIGAFATTRAALPLAERGQIGWVLADGLRVGGMALVLIAVGFGLAGLRSAQVAAPILEWRYYGPVEGRLVDIDRSARDRIRLTLDRVTLRDLAPRKTPARVRLSLMDAATENLPVLGQRVMLTGHLGPPSGPASPGSFDFRQHAWYQELGAVGYTRTPILAISPPEEGLWGMHRARIAISTAIQQRIGGQEGAVAAALMTGDRSGIHEKTNEIMRASNLYHIISISGLHMSMLAGFVYAALRLTLVLAQGVGAPLPQAVHKLAAVGALAAAAAYLWLSGGGVATERAFVMVAVMLCAILVDRRAISLRTVSLAATIILVYSPEALTSPGFQMSFAATIALILTYGPWSRISPHLPIWMRPVLMLLVSSFVAALATSPIAAAHFNRMAQYGLLANMLVVPVMGTLVMPAGVIGAILAPIGLAGPALWVMGLGTAWMLRVADFVAGLNGAVTAVALPPAAVVPLMGFGAALAVLCWRQKNAAPRPLPMTAGFALGLAMLATAFALWLSASRPMILVAPEGEAVGLMTPAGRAVSKPAGGAFVVNTWLLEDGDTANQAQAAARPAWTGDRRDRQASLPDGWRLLHFTGKGSGQRAAAGCRPRHIVVATERVDLPGGLPRCVLLDPSRLRQSGAVAIDMTSSGPQLTTVADRHRAPG
ncbi:ComEC/Rec2 family competence protein [Paracoccus salsus]|uniref:ComEC/Rec2 family competence protein n=1 Tax=Paracoccus salsus TaxID=2911061 RepID=UPI001F3598EB|nr:ComEC/Rec2 family competence protein [Paracoccus salsus]MCF3973085.1 ComEC family competence protein [Paracoccus salsus]